ncbi:hypothetical protein ACTFIU_005837 [Dictyostelium citrinum]
MNKLFNNINKSRLFFYNNNNFKKNLNKNNNNHSSTFTKFNNNKNNSILFNSNNNNNKQIFKLLFSTNSNSSSSTNNTETTATTTTTTTTTTKSNEFVNYGNKADDDIFENQLFSHLNKSDPKANFYDFKFQMADAAISEKEILELIKNEPKNNLHYQKLGAHIGVNGTTILNGKVVGQLDLYLIQIENNPRDKHVFFSLFAFMSECLHLEQVTLLNGEVVTLKDCLIREIGNNPTHLESYLILFSLMDHLIEDTVTINFNLDSLEDENHKMVFNEIGNNGGGGETLQTQERIMPMKLRKLDLLTNVISMDRYNSNALELLTYIMNEGYTDIVIGDKRFTIYEACQLNYIVNKNLDPLAIFYFSEQLNPWYGVFETEKGDMVSKLSLLIEGITKFPNFPNFYYSLAKILKNNNQFVKIKKNSINNNDNNNNNNNNEKEEFIEMNRYDLLRKGFDIIRKEKEYRNKEEIGPYYFEFARLLGLNDTVSFVDYDGVKKDFNKKQLYIKTIETLQGSLDIPVHELLLLMSPNETIIINGKSYSRDDVSKIPHYDSALEKLLCDIFKKEKNIEEFKKNNEIFLKKRAKVIEQFVKAIEEHPSIAYNLSTLGDILEKDEKVYIHGKPYGKIDLFLMAISYDTNSTDSYYKLAREFPNFDSKITLLDGTVKMKAELQEETSLYNSHSLYDFATQSVPQFCMYEESKKSWIMRDCFCNIISMDPLYKDAYLKLGIEMYRYSIDECLIPSVTISTPFIYGKDDIKLSRKQLFIKYIELSQINSEFNESDNLLAWYHLSLEMSGSSNDNINIANTKTTTISLNREEIQFGQTKKDILQSIIKQDETFSRAYSELSTLLSLDSQYDQIIELMVKAIKYESDVNIKSNHYFKLSQYVKDINERVKLDNGTSMNKQQLLVESIELAPRSNSNNNHSLAYHSLAKLLTNSNDTIEIFGKQLNQSELFELALKNSDNFSESLKIKSNQILNDTKNLFF